MDKISLFACGKLNLALDVLSLYGNGFHELDMCMTTIDVGDVVDFVLANDVCIIMNGAISGGENSAYKALSLAVEGGLISGGHVSITKGLPMSSGMGGSSVDAAAVLYAIARIIGVRAEKIERSVKASEESSRAYSLDITDNRYIALENIARKIGSDVVYLMRGGCARAHGKGDDLEVLTPIQLTTLIIMPEGNALTSKVFAEYDKSAATATNYTDKVVANINNNATVTNIGNALSAAAVTVNPNIAIAIDDMKQFTADVAMTGSGSGVYGIFHSENELERARVALSLRYKYCVRAVATPSAMQELTYC